MLTKTYNKVKLTIKFQNLKKNNIKHIKIKLLKNMGCTLAVHGHF